MGYCILMMFPVTISQISGYFTVTFCPVNFMVSSRACDPSTNEKVMYILNIFLQRCPRQRVRIPSDVTEQAGRYQVVCVAQHHVVALPRRDAGDATGNVTYRISDSAWFAGTFLNRTGF